LPRQIPKDRKHIITHAEIAPRWKSDPKGFDMADLIRRIGGQPNSFADEWFVVPSKINVRQAHVMDRLAWFIRR
jgi:hypothetical protein